MLADAQIICTRLTPEGPTTYKWEPGTSNVGILSLPLLLRETNIPSGKPLQWGMRIVLGDLRLRVVHYEALEGVYVMSEDGKWGIVCAMFLIRGFASGIMWKVCKLLWRLGCIDPIFGEYPRLSWLCWPWKPKKEWWGD